MNESKPLNRESRDSLIVINCGDVAPLRGEPTSNGYESPASRRCQQVKPCV